MAALRTNGIREPSAVQPANNAVAGFDALHFRCLALGRHGKLNPWRHRQETICAVNISVTTLDADLVRCLEPRTSSPQARLRAIRELTAAEVQVRVMVAPIIPGLTDVEIPAILQAAAEAGAIGAGWQMLRLPWAVRPIFEDWLAQIGPSSAIELSPASKPSAAAK